MISRILAPLLVVTALSAATYDENYRVTDLDKTVESNFNLFMHGDFERIIRYDMINMDEDDNSFDEIVDMASQEVSQLQDAGKSVQVTIIGHTNRPTDDVNERTVDSDTYANHIQNWFRYSLDTNSSQKRSKNYAQEVQDALVDAGIDRNITYVEMRGGSDQGFTEATDEGRDLSNRVMVALYVSGVQDIDSDRDGVFDYLDECPETPVGFQVDPKGCPRKSELQLNFKTSSDKILQESYPAIQRFAKFMKENPMYKAELIGHTDSRGNAAFNMDLSQRRAAAAKAALIAEGVEASRLKSSGRGELDPIATNRTKEGRLANRRTEVHLTY